MIFLFVVHVHNLTLQKQEFKHTFAGKSMQIAIRDKVTSSSV